MKGDVLLQNIRVMGFIPISVGKNAKETKLLIRESILTKIGKNIDNVRKRCAGKPLSISIVLSLHKESYAKKDLFVLSNTIIKLLGKSTKKDGSTGLEIITNTKLIHRVILEKNLINNNDKEEFTFSIYEWA